MLYGVHLASHMDSKGEQFPQCILSPGHSTQSQERCSLEEREVLKH